MASMKIWGDVYIKLLQVTVLPYIVVSLTASLGRLSYQQASVMARRLSLLLLFIWTLTLAIVLLSIFSFPHTETASFFSTSMIPDSPEPDYISLYIPFNPFFSLAENLVPAVVIFCIMMGTALIGLRDKELVIKPLDVVAEALAKITDFIVRLTPLGLLAIAAAAAGTMHIEDLKQLQVFIWLYIALSIYCTVWVLPGFISTFTNIPYKRIFFFFKDALIMAFFTGSLFVVLPIITRHCLTVIRRYVTRDVNTGNAVEVIVPASFNFPSTGKLLLLLFVPFAGWMTSSDIAPSQFLEFSSLGFFTFFGNVNVAIPWLLDFFRIPADTFNMFMVSSIITSRFATATAAMFTVCVALVGACAMTGNTRFSWTKAGRYLAITFASCILLLVAVGTFFKYAVDIRYEKRDVAMEMKLKLKDAVKAQVFEKPLPPLPLPPVNVPLIHAIRNRGFIRVGYPSHQAMPFSYFNQSHELVGLCIDLAYQLAHDLNVRLELVPFQNKNMVKDLRSNKMDIIMTEKAITPETASVINFTVPFMYETMAFIVPDYKRKLFKSYDIIKRQRVKLAVPDIPYYKAKIRSYFPKAEIVPLKSLEAFFSDRMAGADAMVYTAEAGAFMCLVHPRYTVVVPKGLTLKIPLGFPVRMGGASFVRFMNAWIDLKQQDGTMKRLFDYWIMGKNAKPTRPRWCIARNVLHWMN